MKAFRAAMLHGRVRVWPIPLCTVSSSQDWHMFAGTRNYDEYSIEDYSVPARDPLTARVVLDAHRRFVYASSLHDGIYPVPWSRQGRMDTGAAPVIWMAVSHSIYIGLTSAGSSPVAISIGNREGFRARMSNGGVRVWRIPLCTGVILQPGTWVQVQVRTRNTL